MKEVVINNCFGGFSLSPKAVLKYAELCGFKVYGYGDKHDANGKMIFDNRTFVKLSEKEMENAFIIYWLKNDLGDEIDSETLNSDKAEWLHERDIARDDKNLIKTIRLLKKDANGSHAALKIVKIPDDAEWQIEEYDGSEHIAEKHRTWA